VSCKLQVIQFLEEGILLQKPTGCPDDVYHVMLGCWRRDPQERFAFDRVHRHLLELVDGDGGGAVSTAADQAPAGETMAAGNSRQSRRDPQGNKQHRYQNDDSSQPQQQSYYTAIDFTLTPPT